VTSGVHASVSARTREYEKIPGVIETALADDELETPETGR